jgi:hypothetical protein
MIVSDIGSLSWMLRYEIAYNNHHRMDATVIVVRASFAHDAGVRAAARPDHVRISDMSGRNPAPSANRCREKLLAHRPSRDQTCLCETFLTVPLRGTPAPA